MKMYRVAYYNKRNKPIIKAMVLTDSKENAKKKMMEKVPVTENVSYIDVTEADDIYTF